MNKFYPAIILFDDFHDDISSYPASNNGGARHIYPLIFLQNLEDEIDDAVYYSSVSRSNTLLWNDYSSVVKQHSIPWNLYSGMNGTNRILWNDYSGVGSTCRTLWNDYSGVNKTGQLLWNLYSGSIYNQSYIWNDYSSVAKSDRYLWNLYSGASVQSANRFLWNNYSGTLSNSTFLWNVLYEDQATPVLQVYELNGQITTKEEFSSYITIELLKDFYITRIVDL